MFAVQPKLRREHIRAFDVVSLVKGVPADYSVNQYAFEVYAHQATNIKDKRQAIAKVQPGDVVLITPTVAMNVKNRIVVAQAHDKLYSHGRPSYKQWYRHGDIMNVVVRWECDKTLDMKDLPFLYEAYIVDQHVR